MHCFASENQTYTGTWLFGVESWKSLKGQENLLLKNLQVKTRVENVRFLSWRIFFVGKYGIQSTNEMAFKRTVPLREFSISRHQIWCAHAIVVQRMHACACKNALLLCPAIVLIEHMVPGKKKKYEDISLLDEKMLERRRRLSLKTWVFSTWQRQRMLSLLYLLFM